MNVVEESLTRNGLLEELANKGIERKTVSSLTQYQLSELLVSLLQILGNDHRRPRPRPRRGSTLSLVDKEILEMLMTSSSAVSCTSLSKHLGISITTAQRKRKRLQDLLDCTFSIKKDKLGLRAITFFISTSSRPILDTGNDILEIMGGICAVRSFNNNIDLRVEALVSDNNELSTLEEQIK